MSNKKSQVEDLLSFVFIVIVMVFVALIFSFKDLNKTNSIKESMDSQITAQESGELLINYLNLPMSYKNSQNTNMADALSMYVITSDSDLFRQINDGSNKFFSGSAMESGDYSWSLVIEYPDKKPITINSERSSEIYTSRKELSSIPMPAHYSGKFMSIRLFETRQEVLAG